TGKGEKTGGGPFRYKTCIPPWGFAPSHHPGAPATGWWLGPARRRRPPFATAAGSWPRLAAGGAGVPRLLLFAPTGDKVTGLRRCPGVRPGGPGRDTPSRRLPLGSGDVLVSKRPLPPDPRAAARPGPPEMETLPDSGRGA